ncbi:hypothetical protein LINPERPRIM_LOCUS2568 [Linum perenne]
MVRAMPLHHTLLGRACEEDAQCNLPEGGCR